ncbi:hypothetical protein TRICI_002304 [Trichomonascus ciferrii]|uniref:Zn(2)-C6 fungal-type domain-containing protein n=1 Tax=Trichomonascus ciferrii TaxID=44093 RepID=A0A642V794_9ASCO|nr:hypothetical protein TRICI_002304 [Trichomonascus ciferrii]
MPPYNKNRSRVACAACRSRKTRCDGARPKCSFCQENGCPCKYETPQGPSLETSVDTILQKVSAIEKHLGVENQSGTLVESLVSSSQMKEPSAFPLLTIKDSKFARIVFKQDINLSTFARSLGQNKAVAENTRTAVPPVYSPYQLIKLFFKHSYRWFPILNRRDIYQHKLSLIQNTVQTADPDTFLILMVAAIGGLNANDSAGLHQAEEFHAQAMNMMGCVMEEISLRAIQCVVLLALFYGFKVEPFKAQEYVSIGSIKMQNLIEVRIASGPKDKSSEDNYGLGEYETRAFWALFILESEYAGTLHFSTGLTAYGNDMKYPSLYEEQYQELDPSSPEAGYCDLGTPDPFFLAEIGIRKIIDRTSFTFNSSQYERGMSFAPIVAKELEAQLQEWYSCLPEPIKFDLPSRVVLDAPELSASEHSTCAFARGQYFATRMLIYWPCVMDMIEIDGNYSQMHEGVFNITLDSYICFIHRATTVRLSELPLVWTHAVSIFAMTATVLRLSSASVFNYANPAGLKSAIYKAISFLESVVPFSPSIERFREILNVLHGEDTQ